ncbi:hypothetical protein Arub01_04530 [Actinomadura rubrobrunea]|uniref:Uncharacterized protein n=1 Tax=Actinomadura rubrobrunea TaxID=115335 RepID=A0A9W6UT09_9ACTN|nr:DUF6086 family protein [Actinomadura rubrobrunea]GLW62209.1 hypothetical protein Arub01_04530 [Actinomadura rubrobrunea]
MSIYIKHGDRTIWNPAMGVGRVFIHSVTALEAVAGLPSGVTAVIPDDTYSIDDGELRAFAQELVNGYFSTSHPLYRMMVGGVLKTCLVLLERAGNPLHIDPVNEDHMSFLRELGYHARFMPI